jgi:TolA-binding protein
LTVLVLSLPLTAWAAVPVVDDNASSYPPAGYGTSGAYAGAGASTPASAQGQLFMQLQQMQDQISRQQGIIEELQNDVSRMKQENLERYQDLDRLLVRLPPMAALLPSRLPRAASRVIRRKRSSITMPLST